MSSIEYAYARWATERLALPTEKQVAELELRLSVELPVDYRQYLLQFNGGVFDDPEIVSLDKNCPRRGLFVMYGIGEDEATMELGNRQKTSLFDDNDPLVVLPIGCTAFGDLIVLATATEDRGVIYFKQASGGWFELAEGIEEFFASLRDPEPG